MAADPKPKVTCCIIWDQNSGVPEKRVSEDKRLGCNPFSVTWACTSGQSNGLVSPSTGRCRFDDAVARHLAVKGHAGPVEFLGG